MSTSTPLRRHAGQALATPKPASRTRHDARTPLERRSPLPMRGIVALASTALGLTLLFTFKAPGAEPRTSVTGNAAAVVSAKVTPVVASSAGPNSAAATTPASSTVAATAAAGATTSTPAATAAAATPTATIDGSAVNTRYGAVQVEIVMTNGRLTDIVALQLPSGGRSGAISQSAAATLRSEALQTQSATIDAVSGATFISEAYVQSLKSALAQLNG